VLNLNRQVLLDWRVRFRTKLDALADMISAVVDGGIVLSKVLGEPQALGKQLMFFRSYIAFLFAPTNH